MADDLLRLRGEVLEALESAMVLEGRAVAPADAEQGEWLYGSARYKEVPLNEHGWREPLSEPAWLPKALCFWHIAITTGFPIVPELASDSRHSLARWPDIEQEVRAYLTCVDLETLPVAAHC